MLCINNNLSVGLSIGKIEISWLKTSYDDKKLTVIYT